MRAWHNGVFGWESHPKTPLCHTTASCYLSYFILEHSLISPSNRTKYSIFHARWVVEVILARSKIYAFLSVYCCKNRMEYLQNGFIQRIRCLHSFAICVIFARSIWPSIPVISSPTGTSLPSHCTVSTIYLPPCGDTTTVHDITPVTHENTWQRTTGDF